MSRDPQLYIDDILEAIDAIEEYLDGLGLEEFINDRKTYSATIRELTIIGEAVGKLIPMLQTAAPDYPWRAIKDFRNIVVHEYFGTDHAIVWDLVKNELPILKSIIKGLQ
jgi:uncharacterized protein with HEPN domain